MAGNISQQIAACFAERSGAEFGFRLGEHVFGTARSHSLNQGVLYTTKPACVLHALDRLESRPSIDVVGGCGLPSQRDGESLCEWVGNRKTYYLGDCDPVDLLLFAWLREFVDVVHLGVGDTLIYLLATTLSDAMEIPLAPCEASSLATLEQLCPDYRSLLGPRCAALIARGKKLEVEAVLNFSKFGLADILAGLLPQTPAS
jgi:hypothetical protein